MKRIHSPIKDTRNKKIKKSTEPINFRDNVWLEVLLMLPSRDCLQFAKSCPDVAKMLLTHQQTAHHNRMLGVLQGRLSTDKELMLIYKDHTWSQCVSDYFDVQFGPKWRDATSTENKTSWSPFASLLELLFRSNREQAHVRFVVAGGFLFPCVYHHIHYPDDQQKLTKYLSNEEKAPADIDVFLVGPSQHKEHAFSTLMRLVHEWVSTCQPVQPLFVLRDFTLTISCANSEKILQFVLPINPSIGALITLFDLPCCSWAFDGQTVTTIPEGERAIVLRRNDIHPLSPAYRTTRSSKYAKRDVVTKAIRYHPLQHLLSLKDYCELSNGHWKRIDEWKALIAKDTSYPASEYPHSDLMDESSQGSWSLLSVQRKIEYGGSFDVDKVLVGHCWLIHVVSDTMFRSLTAREPLLGLKQTITYTPVKHDLMPVLPHVIKIDTLHHFLPQGRQSLMTNCDGLPFVQHFTRDLSLLAPLIEAIVTKNLHGMPRRQTHIHRCDCCTQYAIFPHTSLKAQAHKLYRADRLIFSDECYSCRHTTSQR